MNSINIKNDELFQTLMVLVADAEQKFYEKNGVAPNLLLIHQGLVDSVFCKGDQLKQFRSLDVIVIKNLPGTAPIQLFTRK